jgi:hypothetical protein
MKTSPVNIIQGNRRNTFDALFYLFFIRFEYMKHQMKQFEKHFIIILFDIFFDIYFLTDDSQLFFQITHYIFFYSFL